MRFVCIYLHKNSFSTVMRSIFLMKVNIGHSRSNTDVTFHDKNRTNRAKKIIFDMDNHIKHIDRMNEQKFNNEVISGHWR